MIYVDTNVWLYAILAHPIYGEGCKGILKGIELGEVEAAISTQVLSEVAGVLYSQCKVRDVGKYVAVILSYPLRVIDLSADMVLQATRYSEEYGISPYDGRHVAAALSASAPEILSADKELDKVGIIERVDPLEFRDRLGRSL
ncbi:MAG: type II toxin-antitoxin system VapC family toxin [Candidatus Bathyarchaeia archaeon]